MSRKFAISPLFSKKSRNADSTASHGQQAFFDNEKPYAFGLSDSKGKDENTSTKLISWILVISIIALSAGFFASLFRGHQSQVESEVSDNALILPGIAFQLSNAIDLTPKTNAPLLAKTTIAQNQLASHFNPTMLNSGRYILVVDKGGKILASAPQSPQWSEKNISDFADIHGIFASLGSDAGVQITQFKDIGGVQVSAHPILNRLSGETEGYVYVFAKLREGAKPQQQNNLLDVLTTSWFSIILFFVPLCGLIYVAWRFGHVLSQLGKEKSIFEQKQKEIRKNQLLAQKEETDLDGSIFSQSAKNAGLDISWWEFDPENNHLARLYTNDQGKISKRIMSEHFLHRYMGEKFIDILCEKAEIFAHDNQHSLTKPLQFIHDMMGQQKLIATIHAIEVLPESDSFAIRFFLMPLASELNLALNTHSVPKNDEETKFPLSRLQNMFNTVDIGLLLVNPEGKITGINKMFIDFFALDRDKNYIGISLESLYDQLHPPAWKEIKRDSVGQTGTERYVVRCEVDQNFYELAEIFDEQQGFAMLVNQLNGAVIRSYMESKNNFTLNKQSAEALACEALKAQSADLVQRINHSLRTPLNHIVGFAESLKQAAGLSGRDRNYLHHIVASSEELQEAVDAILFHLELNLENPDIEKTPQNLWQILDGMSYFWRKAAGVNNRKFGLDIDALTCICEIDETLFRKMMNIIFENALKYSSEEDWIIVRMRRVQGKVIITITDSGVGVDKAQILTIKSKFGLIENDDLSAFSHQSGMKLGLASAQKICTLHGGVMRLKSRKGVGTMVYIALPVSNKSVPIDDYRSIPNPFSAHKSSAQMGK